MLTYIVRRLLTMIMTLLAVSALVFVIIQLPPGDYLTTYIAELESQGEMVLGLGQWHGSGRFWIFF
jgi:peptide/nickel transport system permease protein